MFKIRNQRGFSHHLLLPVLAIFGIGAIGVFLTIKSSAATATNGSVVYKQKVAGTPPYKQFYKNISGVTSQYGTEVGEIADISLDQKWILTQEFDSTRGVNQYVARSLDGTTHFIYPSAFSNIGTCTTPTYTASQAKFSKVMNDTTPPKIYFVQNVTPCVSGQITYTGEVSFYSIDVDDQNKTLLKQYSNTHGILFATTQTGTVSYWLYNMGYKIVQPSGTTYSPGKNIYDVVVSENGQKVALSGTVKGIPGVYVGNIDGTSMKRVAKTAYVVNSISPDGKKFLYQKALDSTTSSVGLYAFTISTKVSVKLDSGFGRQRKIGSAIQSESWSHDSAWVIYGRIDKKTSKAEVRKVRANATGRTVVAGLPYAATQAISVYW